jgi:hypothetical protein
MPVSIKTGEITYLTTIRGKDAKGNDTSVTVPATQDALYTLPDTTLDGPPSVQDCNHDEPGFSRPCKAYKFVMTGQFDPDALLKQMQTDAGLQLSGSAGGFVHGHVSTIVTPEGYTIVELHCYQFDEPAQPNRNVAYKKAPAITPTMPIDSCKKVKESKKSK